MGFDRPGVQANASTTLRPRQSQESHPGEALAFVSCDIESTRAIVHKLESQPQHLGGMWIGRGWETGDDSHLSTGS